MMMATVATAINATAVALVLCQARDEFHSRRDAYGIGTRRGDSISCTVTRARSRRSATIRTLLEDRPEATEPTIPCASHLRRTYPYQCRGAPGPTTLSDVCDLLQSDAEIPIASFGRRMRYG